MADVRINHAALQGLATDPHGPVAAYVGRVAERVAEVARSNAPVGETGHLVASIRATPIAGTAGWQVIAAADYAIYVEARRHFLRDALREVKEH